MDFGTLIGLFAGVGIIAIGVLRGGGDLYWFFSLNSVLIVFGGTLAAAMVNYPLKNILGLFGVLKNAFSSEEYDYQNRHKMGQEIFFYLGAYAPAFGMLGTVMGLIIMMNNFSGGNVADINSIDFDIAKKFSQLLSGMGLALITTFYGVLLANLVFLPIGGKLTRKSQEEMMLKSIVVEGIISIHSKEHPILMREKLMTFVPQSARIES